MKTLCNIPATLFAAAVLMAGLCPAANNVHISSLYLVDAGSYLSNDVAHVAIAKNNPQLPDDTEITVSARLLSSNVWVQLSPPLTFAQFPHDYALADATNYALRVSSPSTFQVRSAAVTFPARGVRVFTGPEIGMSLAGCQLVVEEWQASSAGRISYGKLVVGNDEIEREYEVGVPGPGTVLRWGLGSFAAASVAGAVSADGVAWANSATGRADGAFCVAAPYPLPAGTARSVGALDAADGSLATDLRRWCLLNAGAAAATGGVAHVRLAWTPAGFGGLEAWAPLPLAANLPTNAVIAVTADLDGNGEYSPGEPYGAYISADGSYAAPAVELAWTHPSVLRLDLVDALQNNTFAAQVGLNDRGVRGYGVTNVAARTLADHLPGAGESAVRVRIALSAINGRYFIQGQGSYLIFPNLLAFDRRLDMAAGRCYLDETDLMAAGILDVGWGKLDAPAQTLGIGLPSTTQVVWRIVIGDGPILTSVTNNNLATAFENMYDQYRPACDYVTPADTVFAGAPTFKWRHDSTCGKRYPAFSLSVYSAASGNSTLYSVEGAAPPRDANGVYTFTPPIAAGVSGFGVGTNYYWAVSMLDAKFPTAETSPARRAFLFSE